MGLPQVSSGEPAEGSVGSLSTFVFSVPRFVSPSTCDLDGMHVGSISQMVGEPLCSSLENFQEKTSLDRSKIPDDSVKCKGVMDAISNVDGLKIGHNDKRDGLTHNTGQSNQSHAFRIMGFECNRKNYFLDRFTEVSTDHVHSSSAVDTAVKESESNGSPVRKRLFSPLCGMVFADQFTGDPVANDCCNCQVNSPDSYSVSMAQDHKKANVGSRNRFTTPIWSVSNCSERKNVLSNNSRMPSFFPTDGPLLDEKEVLPYTGFSSHGLDPLRESSKVRTRTGAINIFQENVISSPLCLSPLGPKYSETMKTAGGCRKGSKDIECGCLAFKNVEHLFDESNSGIIFAPEEDKFWMASKSYEDNYHLHRGSHLSSLQSNNGKNWTSSRDSIPHCINLGRSLRGLPIRRSLVGSFEESLLSGGLSCGKLSQRIDGFLAVLSITGGSFSPKSQKLPFAVTSVDGDNYLLYYASINLGGIPSNDYRCQNFKRGLGGDESHDAKNRLRIPVKGCIQLV
ncbi:hypothetical protein U1Q18_042203, partial [Sarracenia purpurea var. burkii]